MNRLGQRKFLEGFFFRVKFCSKQHAAIRALASWSIIFTVMSHHTLHEAHSDVCLVTAEREMFYASPLLINCTSAFPFSMCVGGECVKYIFIIVRQAHGVRSPDSCSNILFIVCVLCVLEGVS